ncbi:MAG: UbiX family flavin prenyltransferase [Bacteroidales bacterium]|nr:UbiX family flavin prenyltransferase [Bacteroidales bacterium]
MPKKIILAITGASGSVYAQAIIKSLLKPELQVQYQEVKIVLSSNAEDVWKYELGFFDKKQIPFKTYDKNDFSAPFASGSAGFETMIIAPCSMGTLGRIAHGISNDLISRAADVILKERRKLILLTRETPLNLIHINNMKIVTEAGGIICPATPSFYSKPQSIDELIKTVTDRVLQLAGFELDTYRWKG